MKNEKLKNSLDDALSGIGEDPWLLRKVLARAESEEEVPVKKRISMGTVVIVLLIVLLMSAGIAGVTQWNVLDFLREWGREPAATPTPVAQEAETDGARMRVEAALYNGESLAFDLTLENKKPEAPVWCYVDELSIDGVAYTAGEFPNGDMGFSIVDCNYSWLPEKPGEDSIVHCGELIRLVPESAGKDTIHVCMRVKLFRPNRPVTIYAGGGTFREALEKKIAEGYYVIPAGGDGFFVPEEDLSVCPNGWAMAVSSYPPEDVMGGVTEETLEISFDTGIGMERNRQLQTREIYENEYCTAVYEQADLTLAGLGLKLKITPKEGMPRLKKSCLTDGKGNPLEGEEYVPVAWGDREKNGEWIIEHWYPAMGEADLPDPFSLTCVLDNGENLIFPVTFR